VSTVERFDAMGTWVEVRADSDAGHAEVRRVFASAEARFSRFLEDSELSRINDDPADRVEVSASFAAVLREAADLHERTGGLVDPAVGGRVIDWGYDRTFGELPDLAAAPQGSLDHAGWTLEGRTLHRAPGTRFDLGGIVKGWTADEAVEAGLADVVSAGGDLRSRDPATIVDIVDPWGESAARLALGTGGLATSSIGRRRWISAGGPAHHIIDPRTGDPAVTPIVSASVVAETAAKAEAGAKAVLILGAEGLAWAALQPWIRSAVAIWTDGNVYATPGVEVAA
jgi:thiamine biosynthesis lipoprotein